MIINCYLYDIVCTELLLITSAVESSNNDIDLFCYQNGEQIDR